MSDKCKPVFENIWDIKIVGMSVRGQYYFLYIALPCRRHFPRTRYHYLNIHIITKSSVMTANNNYY